MRPAPAKILPNVRKLEILVVEDHYADSRWVQCVLDEIGLPHALTVIGDGAHAWLFLQKQGDYATASTPDLVLLDLNLPKMNGDEILELLWADEALANIPVCVVSSSELERRKLLERGLHPSCYIVKPLGYQKIRGALESYDELRPYVAILRKPTDHLFA
jgi:CheY-like chemotaxis protein